MQDTRNSRCAALPEWYFVLLIHKVSHREVYQDFQPSLSSIAGLFRSQVLCTLHRLCINSKNSKMITSRGQLIKSIWLYGLAVVLIQHLNRSLASKYWLSSTLLDISDRMMISISKSISCIKQLLVLKVAKVNKKWQQYPKILAKNIFSPFCACFQESGSHFWNEYLKQAMI